MTQGLDIREALADTKVDNPALARLQRDLTRDAPTEQVITSYDRMHHRHNRS
ncbi:MAG: hypothetical protein JWN67_2331 [Actinomycetia bacterium]|nr:hypothetical protein [Actinomycetes bacterium]